MPELRFQRDVSIEAGQRIEAILQDVLPSPQETGKDAPDGDDPAFPGAADPEEGTGER